MQITIIRIGKLYFAKNQVDELVCSPSLDLPELAILVRRMVLEKLLTKEVDSVGVTFAVGREEFDYVIESSLQNEQGLNGRFTFQLEPVMGRTPARIFHNWFTGKSNVRRITR